MIRFLAWIDRHASWVVLFALLASAALFLASCDDANRPASQTAAAATQPAPEAPASRIAALEARLAKATADRDELARLSALRDLLAERERQAVAEAERLHRDLDATLTALSVERQHALEVKAWWFVGIMGAAALAAAALAVFVPATARWAVRAALAAAACAALALAFAALLPWLLWIGLGLVVVGLIAAIVWWRLDAKSRDQVVTAVEGIKEKLPAYRDHFRSVIDSDADRAIDATRRRLRLKP